MSAKRRGNVMEDSSSDEDITSNDPRDLDYDVSSSGRSVPPRRKNSIASSCDSVENRPRGRATTKRPCLNRNALLARENRQRKKEYVEKIENKLSFFRQENKNLTNMIKRQDIDLKRLRGEVSYLRNVLNNSSCITNLLKSMNETLSGKQKNISCHDNQQESRKNLHKTIPSDSCLTEKKQKDEVSLQISATRGLRRRAAGVKHAEINKKITLSSTGDSDHTYTTSSRDGSLNNDDYARYHEDSEENALYAKNNDRMLLEMPGDGAFINGDNVDSLNLEISDELDQLPQFDENIFESLGNCNDNDESLDNYFRHAVDSLNESGNLFENLDNSGICLHVNSGKISLEFCSICHLNSVNSSE